MRNATNALALLLGVAVLIGTAVPTPAGAQDAAEDEGAPSAPDAAPPEGEPTDAPEGAPSAETPDADQTPDAEAPEPTEPATTAPDAAATDAAEPATVTDATEPATAPEPALEATPEPTLAATPDPAPAESTEQSTPTDPAIEGGDATDSAAEAEPTEEAPAPAGPALTFANSFFNYTNQVTLNSFAPGGQLTYNPWWQMNFSLTPRFYLTDTTFLWLNQGVAVDITRSDWTTYAHEPILTDTTLDIRQNIRWEGFVFQLQGRLAFPLSKASQSAQRILQTGLGLSIARPFPELAALTIGATFGYRRWWATRSTPQIQGPAPDYDTQTGESFCEPLAGRSVCTQAGSQTTARDILVAGLSLTVMPISGLTLQFQGVYLGMYGHHIATAQHDVQGKTVVIEDDSPTHWRHFTYFALAVGYQIIPSLNVSLGIQNSANVAQVYNPDGSVRSPFNPDTSVFLTATVGIDTLVKELTGESDDDLTPEERQRRRQGLARRGASTSF